VVERCLGEGLVGGEGFAVDASLIAAAASEVTPKFISPSDPAAQWTGAHKGHAFFAYATNYLIDTDNTVILDVEASRATAGRGRRITHHDRSDRSALRAQTQAARRGQRLWIGRELGLAVKERQIEPHIPVFDKSNRTNGTFSRSDFVFDPERNHYTCPQGKLLVQFRRSFKTPRSCVTKNGTRLYRTSKSDCQACALKPR
jgi:hypothetical protein